MAHMIESMAYVGATPWHGLGEELQEGASIAEFIVKSGLNTTVEKRQLYMADGRKVDAFATVRVEDGAILGHHVGPQYTPLQNIDAFRFFQPFLDAGQATLHTAGSLDGGRRVWVLAKITKGLYPIADGDDVEAFSLLSHGHDGTLAVRCGFTPIRVVCQNTLSMAHGSAASKLLRVRHTAAVKDTLEQIRDVMDLARQEFAATAQQYRQLAQRHINATDLRKYVRKVFEVDEQDPKDDSTRIKNIMDDVVSRSILGVGNDMPSVRGSLWTAYNGVTEWLSHARGNNQDTRLNSLWFGSGADLSKRALEVALAMAS